MNATAALLWATSRPALDNDLVAAALQAGADVEYAADIAIAQRVGPLLHRGLGSHRPSPPRLQRDAQRCGAQSRILLPRVGEMLLTPLHKSGFEALVIKGAALAPRYPDPALRPMDDVDLLVRAKDFDGARDALLATGWTIAPSASRSTHEITLVHPEMPGLAVDLHQRWASRQRRSNRLNADDLWNARVPTELYGAPAFVLPREEELVTLAAHAAKPYHGFDRLIWITDLGVVASGAPLDWDRVAAFAHAARCRVAVAVGLIQAQRIGVDAPPHLLRISSRTRRRALAPVLGDDWPLQDRNPQLRDRLRYGLVDNLGAAGRLAIGEAFASGSAHAPLRSARVAKSGVRRYWQRRQENAT